MVRGSPWPGLCTFACPTVPGKPAAELAKDTLQHAVLFQTHICRWVGPPGLAVACLALLTLDEPRAAPGAGVTGPPAASSRFLPSSSSSKSVGPMSYAWLCCSSRYWVYQQVWFPQAMLMPAL